MAWGKICIHTWQHHICCPFVASVPHWFADVLVLQTSGKLDLDRIQAQALGSICAYLQVVGRGAATPAVSTTTPASSCCPWHGSSSSNSKR
eukprot:scaffold205702_cov19-Tisochrysis_lutea.AAC.1